MNENYQPTHPMKLPAYIAFAIPLIATPLSNGVPQEDGVSITVSGQVEAIYEDAFTFSHNGGSVNVEMDALTWYLEDPDQLEGKRVTVTGVVRNDYFDARVIQAESVSVEEADRTIRSNAPEDGLPGDIPSVSLDTTNAEVRGVVTEINEASFVMDSAGDLFEVDISALPENPLDHVGTLRLTEGLRVKVEGPFRPGFFESGRIVATHVEPIAAPSEASKAEDVDASRFASLMKRDDTVVIDVRTPEEIAEGKIKGALEIDFTSPTFAKKATQLPKDKTLLLYCRSGNRSGQAAEFLQSRGYSDMAHLVGGIGAWKDAGYALATD